MIDKGFWRDKHVLITGHTGFKGTWLCLWLTALGAKVTGYALRPPTNPSLYELCQTDALVNSILGDIRDKHVLGQTIAHVDPDIIIHMAAQPLVGESYLHPVETYETNVLGTVYLLDAVRALKSQKNRAFINVTTDKCYENKEWIWGYRENDRLGGYDPYSNSKACSELVTSSYRDSFFSPKDYAYHRVGIASARAGNVIGGGDWAANRLIPDCIRSLLKGEKVKIRNRKSVRPWQHVLEPLSGYINLAQKLYELGPQYSSSWNFGPNHLDHQSVEWVVQEVCESWGEGAAYEVTGEGGFHESHYLKLDCSKAAAELNWSPRWSLTQAIDKVVEWVKAYQRGENLRGICLKQIEEYSKLAEVKKADD